jgi:hypothetical protein
MEPSDFIDACTVNKYSLASCDDKFYQEYIQKHFKPHLGSFTLPLNSNWESYLNVLVNGTTLPVRIVKNYNGASTRKTTMNIRFEDTLQDIVDKCKNSISDNYAKMEVLLATGKADALILTIYHSNAKLWVNKVTTSDNLPTTSDKKFFTLDTLVTKINGNERFYFDLKKIIVYIEQKSNVEKK